MSTLVSPSDALELLLEGNRRFSGSMQDEVAAAALEHRPIAAVLGCSDARVPPPLIFGQPLGRIFHVLVAGNTVSEVVRASLSFAVDYLQVPLVVVLGHDQCGAVTGAVQVATQGVDVPSALRGVLDPLLPAARAASAAADPVAEAVRANIVAVTREVAEIPAVAEARAAGTTALVGSCYDIESGNVTVIVEA